MTFVLNFAFLFFLISRFRTADAEAEQTYLRKQVLDRAPFVSNPLITLAHYILQGVDRQGELRPREERGEIRRVEGREYQNEYPPCGEQDARRVCKRDAVAPPKTSRCIITR